MARVSSATSPVARPASTIHQSATPMVARGFSCWASANDSLGLVTAARRSPGFSEVHDVAQRADGSAKANAARPAQRSSRRRRTHRSVSAGRDGGKDDADHGHGQTADENEHDQRQQHNQQRLAGSTHPHHGGVVAQNNLVDRHTDGETAHDRNHAMIDEMMESGAAKAAVM